MAAAQEFHDYADEHFGWAETAKTERERAIFMQMAAAWLEVALQWEAAEGAGEIAQAVLAWDVDERPPNLGDGLRALLRLRREQPATRESVHV